MIFYFYNTYRARLSQHVFKTVVCEKCRCQFGYHMFRQAFGSGHSPYMLDNAGAAARAGNQAQGWLQYMLQHHTDPVPCPDCGWFQEAMVQEARRRPAPRLQWYGPWLATVNQRWPCTPTAAPGGPSPLRLAPGNLGVPSATAAGLELAPPIDPAGGVLIRLGRDSLPNICCMCLRELRSPALSPRQVPVCADCAAQFKGPSAGKILLWILGWPAAITVGAAVLVAALLVLLQSVLGPGNVLSKLPEEQCIIFGVLAGMALGGVAFIVGMVRSFQGPPRPSATSAPDRMTNVARLTFRNPAFAHIVQAHLASQPLPPAPQTAAS